MKRVSRLHIGDIGKSFSAAFFLVTVLWCIISHQTTGTIFVSLEILLGNLAVSAFLSFLIYRLRYHRVLFYDEEKFAFTKGSKVTENRWRDFSLASLFHTGYGVFTVRLYRTKDADETDFVELPATELGLNPHDFRSEITKLLSN